MKISAFLEQFKEISLATQEDNQDILDFFDSLPMKGEGIKIKYDRRPDFFSFLKENSENYFVFLMRVKGKLEGLGTIVLREGMINGQHTTVGYLGDLRVRPGLKNSATWRRFYSSFMNSLTTLDEFKEVTHLQTAIMGDNIEAKKSLVDSDRHGLHYHLLSNYKMINVLKNRNAISHGLKVRWSTPADRFLMKAFFQREENAKQFGRPDLFDWSLAHWHQFNLNSFVLAFDGGELAGMAGTWYPGATKRIMVSDLPLSMRLARPFVWPLGIHLPKNQGELKTLYFTHLNVRDHKVLSDMIVFVFKNGLKDKHVLSFSDFEGQDFESKLSGFLMQNSPMSLYQVTNEKDENKLLPLTHAPGLEMALI